MGKKVDVYKLQDGSGKQATFVCPGCNTWHTVNVEGSERPVWGFNGDIEKPTFSPSILVTYPANPEADEEFKEWRDKRICHSFVTDGRIRFLNDCTHELAGKTVELPEYTKTLKR